ncbi:MAG: hypothetical protein L3J83_09985 [Proteobacteria bacterium]|nr:hypothetical protein [Pseudomonadota bacterium]
MNKYLLYAPMAIFGIAGLALYIYFIGESREGAFRENLVPELIGFCLEGFFWIGLLSYVQKTREHDRRKELWLSLRGSLRSFLSYLDIAFLDNNAEPISSAALEQNPKIIESLLEQLETNELDLESMVLLKKTSINSILLIRDLVPVAAQLSAAHMSWWIAISDSMRRIKDSDCREKLEKHTVLLLKNVQEFDNLKY